MNNKQVLSQLVNMFQHRENGDLLIMLLLLLAHLSNWMTDKTEEQPDRLIKEQDIVLQQKIIAPEFRPNWKIYKVTKLTFRKRLSKVCCFIILLLINSRKISTTELRYQFASWLFSGHVVAPIKTNPALQLTIHNIW